MSLSKPSEPTVNFLREFIGFTAARIYLLKIDQLAVIEPESKIALAKTTLMQNLNADYINPTNYFVSQLFITYVAAFEIFLQESIALVIKKNPKKVGNIKFSITDILDSVSIDLLIQRATEDYLNTLMYKRPSEYLSELCKILSIDESIIAKDWPVFIEAKARRDLGVHNAWKCNEIYIRKIKESGKNSTLAIGENTAPKENDYLEKVAITLKSLVETISKEVLKKHWNLTID